MSQSLWYYAVNEQRVGPVAFPDVIKYVTAKGGPQTFVFGPGFREWKVAGDVAQIVEAVRELRKKSMAPTKLNFEILGDDAPYLELQLEPAETILAEAGTLMYMGPGVKMETIYGDPSRNRERGLGAALMAAGRRLVSGNSLYVTSFTNLSRKRATVALAAPQAGSLLSIDLKEVGGELVCQKDAFLCAAAGTQLEVAFQKRLGSTLLGGEGFLMQRMKGQGQLILHVGGSLRKLELSPDEKLRVDTGCLVAASPSIVIDIEFAGDVRSAFFGGEGVFVATVQGPGTIWLQSLPQSRIINRLQLMSKARDRDEVSDGKGVVVASDAKAAGD